MPNPTLKTETVHKNIPACQHYQGWKTIEPVHIMITRHGIHVEKAVQSSLGSYIQTECVTCKKGRGTFIKIFKPKLLLHNNKNRYEATT